MLGLPSLAVLSLGLGLFLAPLPADAKQEGCHCHRTMKGREHLMTSQLPTLSLAEQEEHAAFPKHLDWCERGFCVPSWNQHIPTYCGSCYLHGAMSSAQDRIKILNQQRGFHGADVMLGRQSFLNCAPGHGLSNGCDGGEASDVYEFMKQYGVPDESCLPYNATDYSKFKDTNGTCPPEGYCMNCMYTRNTTGPTCFPVTKLVRYRAKSYGHLQGEYAMMKELQNGPITCGISCSDNFTYDYRAGILHDTTGFMDIDHDVEVVGWGEEDGVKYWHVRNSWGTYWGMNGFFKIVRGINNLGIEADCAFMEPDISEEELVWEQKPVYGGSLFGIVPLSNAAESHHPIEDTTDVTKREVRDAPTVYADLHTQISVGPETLPAAASGRSHSNELLFFIAGCGCTTLLAVVLLKARLRHQRYAPIH